MMKKTGILLLLFILLYSKVWSQSLEAIYCFSSYKISGTYFVDVDQNYYDEYTYQTKSRMFNTGLGYYQPVYSPSRNLTFGLNAMYTGGFLYNSSGDRDVRFVMDFALPITGTIKFGAGSNKRSTWPVGFGIGYGYRQNILMVDGDVFRIDEDKIFFSYFRPYYYFEISIDYQKRRKIFFDDFKIRVALQPALRTNTYDSKFEDYTTNTFEYISFSFIKFRQLKTKS